MVAAPPGGTVRARRRLIAGAAVDFLSPANLE
jgi:hypothetical protein